MAAQQGQGELNPQYVAKVEFNLARRGYEPAEVRALLNEVARNLAALHAREAELRRRLAEFEEAPEPTAPTLADLDEAELTALLGEKTTQVLEAARDAASDIHRRAVEKARALVDQATEDAQRIRGDSEGITRTARERAEEVERKADQRSKHLVRNAESEANRTRTAAETTLGAARVRATEIETEAEKTAAALTASAEEQTVRAKARAETLLTAARAEAETVEAETQKRVSHMLREAEERIGALRAEADADIARRLAEADQDAERLVKDAEMKASAAEAAGHVEGKRLVAEAMAAREQTLRDLAQRRRAAHLQLAQLKLGRDRLVEAYAVVQATAEQASQELADVVDEARLAAEAHADATVGNETAMSLEQLENVFGVDRLDRLDVLGNGDSDTTVDQTENGHAADVEAEAEAAGKEAAEADAPVGSA